MIVKKTEIIICKEPITEPSFRFLLQFVPKEKQNRIFHQRVKQNADNMLVGATLARYMVWETFHIPLSQQHIAYGPYGKPYLRDWPNVHFNISHSGQYVACAVANRPVGIDVQVIGAYRPDVAARVCTGKELARLRASDDPAIELARLWTQKEASLKMLGSGITGNIREVLTGDEAQIKTIILPNAVLSVAYRL